MSVPSTELRDLILASLAKQGFATAPNGAMALAATGKDAIRKAHALSLQHKRDVAMERLRRYQKQLQSHFAEVSTLNIDAISPELIEVLPGTFDELLFRYATLHWSIPVSSGYGRRLRFIVRDETNGKLIGLIGLGDPVYSLRVRDQWIGWSQEEKKTKLRHVMDAFVLGAVEPYSRLLCGKLTAMLVASDQVQGAFRRKYCGRDALISGTSSHHPLALITTLSALGRSSIYNRIRLSGRPLYIPVGYSSGSGDFQFSNGTYKSILEFTRENTQWTAKHRLWGTGTRNRREVVRKCLQLLGLKEDLMYHGIKRQVFLVPVALNAKSFLAGQDTDLVDGSLPSTTIFRSFRDRWLSRPETRQRLGCAACSVNPHIWPSSDAQGEADAEYRNA